MSTVELPSPTMTLIEHGVEHGIHWVTCRAPLYGAANGYVKIPEDHPWHGLGYDDIDVRVHGGLTYGGGDGWVGFDCLHYGDYWPGQEKYGLALGHADTEWTDEMVAEETRELARKVAAAGREDI